MIKRTMSKQDVDTIYLSLAALVSFIHPILIPMVVSAWFVMWLMYRKEKPKDG